jgi:signal transduction histidine kinase
MNAAAALVLAVVCGVAWIIERRQLAKLMFCLTAVATAIATPFELGMMQAITPVEYGEWLRWYHLPIFFSFVGQLLFVHYYLGTGRRWLLWTIIPIRVFILASNFFFYPNFNFREIASLSQLSFLGQQVSVVGRSEPRSWQWLAIASMLLMVTFVVDATIQAWRKGGPDAQRRALTVGLAFVAPMVGNLALNQMVVSGVLHIPICATLWFLGTLTVIAYELTHELIANGRARLQLAEVRSEWAQVERVNSLGQLSSGLAHELVQPLTAIQANAEVAQQYLSCANPDLKDLRSVVNDIYEDSRRGAELIERMRTLIKRRELEMQPFELSDVMQGVMSLLRHEASARQILLKCSVQPGLPTAEGDRVHISQVLVNLLINGMDAVQDCPASSRIVVVEARTDAAGNIEIGVQDSGPGIPNDGFEEVFDPLFTTKSRGMGVGLALSRMIVDAHGGRLWALNSDTGGAIFRFTLPQAHTAHSLGSGSVAVRMRAERL